MPAYRVKSASVTIFCSWSEHCYRMEVACIMKGQKMIAVTAPCFGCQRLVTEENGCDENQFLTNSVYCSSCKDLGHAEIMTGQLNLATSLLPSGRLDIVNGVLFELSRRLRFSFASLLVLRQNGLFVEHNLDPATILRAMYD